MVDSKDASKVFYPIDPLFGGGRFSVSDWQRAEEHIERAGEFVRTGRWSDAERELRRATELDPSQGEWHALLGTTLDALDRPEEALVCVRQAAALLPEDPDPLIGAAEICQRLERWEDALDFALRALELEPEDELIHALRISSLGALGRGDEAEVAYFLAQQSIEHMPRCLVAMGDLQLSRHRFDQASWCFHEAMRQDATIPRLRSRIAAIHAATGKPQRALQLHLAELREHPTSIDTLLECGSLLLNMRRPQEAMEKFRRVLEVEPAHLEAHWRIAQASLDEGQFDQARVGFEVVRRLDPDTPMVRRRLAEALLGCNRSDEAKRQLVEAFDRVDESEPLGELDRLAELMIQVDMIREARHLLEEVMGNSAAATNVNVLRRLAVCRYRTGNRGGGAILSRRVLRLEPTCVRSMHNLALAALEDDRLLSAGRWVTRGLREAPDDAGLRRVRSRVWARLAWVWTLGLPDATKELAERILKRRHRGQK